MFFQVAFFKGYFEEGPECTPISGRGVCRQFIPFTSETVSVQEAIPKAVAEVDCQLVKCALAMCVIVEVLVNC